MKMGEFSATIESILSNKMWIGSMCSAFSVQRDIWKWGWLNRSLNFIILFSNSQQPVRSRIQYASCIVHIRLIYIHIVIILIPWSRTFNNYNILLYFVKTVFWLIILWLKCVIARSVSCLTVDFNMISRPISEAPYHQNKSTTPIHCIQTRRARIPQLQFQFQFYFIIWSRS